MKYNEPLIVQELNSLYRRNSRLISKLEKLKHDFRMLLSRKTSDYGQLKEEAEAVYQSLVNIRFEFDFLNSDLNIVQNAAHKYFNAPELDDSDIIFTRAFINKAAHNCMICSDKITRLQNLLKKYPAKKPVNLKFRADLILRNIGLYLSQNSSCILFILKRNKTKHLMAEIELNENAYAVSQNELKTGDVVLIYADKTFLRKHWVAKLISISEGSSIIHAAIVYVKKPGEVRWIAAQGYGGKVEMTEITKKEGETLLVFRPNIDYASKKKLHKSIENWARILSGKDVFYGFSNLKFLFALFEGLFYRLSAHITRRLFIMKNPFHQTTRMYCSEFINKIFYDAGVILTPRSIDSSLVAPVELSFAHCLEFLGVVKDAKIVPDNAIK